MGWTKEQQEAIDLEGKNIIVSAGAGSGKTAVLTERTLRKLKSGIHINNLLILTFTNAAAMEMKERIRKAINKTPGLEEEANLIDGAYITTFDSFSLSIVKKYHTRLNITSNIKITDENIKNIVSLTDKYILDRFNPDKSIDLLDSVCAMKEVESTKEKDISKLKEKLLNIVKKKESMVKKNDFDEALKYRSMEIKLQEKIDKEENMPIKITEKDIKVILERKNNIPFIENNFKDLENYLLNNIIGQKEAIREIINALKQKEEDLPVSILLTGSTGVGKTKTVKEIAKYLDIPLIRLDLSEYNESVSITRLIGSSAGYVGYDDENIFEKVRMNPHSIILLDELEKAHPNVINLFLQILDEGYITNSKGEKIDFKNTYIFMTSNAEVNQKIGFIKGKGNYQNSFSKEFLARITSKINYNNITEEMIKEYLDKKGIKDYSVVKDFDYENQGFRGLDKYLKTKKAKVR